MKYPERKYKSLGEIEKQFPARYYSIELHLQAPSKNIFRVYDSMGMLVHQAIVKTDK